MFWHQWCKKEQRIKSAPRTNEQKNRLALKPFFTASFILPALILFLKLQPPGNFASNLWNLRNKKKKLLSPKLWASATPYTFIAHYFSIIDNAVFTACLNLHNRSSIKPSVHSLTKSNNSILVVFHLSTMLPILKSYPCKNKGLQLLRKLFHSPTQRNKEIHTKEAVPYATPAGLAEVCWIPAGWEARGAPSRQQHWGPETKAAHQR